MYAQAVVEVTKDLSFNVKMVWCGIVCFDFT